MELQLDKTIMPPRPLRRARVLNKPFNHHSLSKVSRKNSRHRCLQSNQIPLPLLRCLLSQLPVQTPMLQHHLQRLLIPQRGGKAQRNNKSWKRRGSIRRSMLSGSSSMPSGRLSIRTILIRSSIKSGRSRWISGSSKVRV